MNVARIAVLVIASFFFSAPIALLLSGCQSALTSLADSRDDRGYVVHRTKLFRDFQLQSGVVLPELVVAYQTHGRLNPAGTNAILVTHGLTASFHMAGRYAPDAAPPGIPADTPGAWDVLIGPGKVLDTERYFIVSSALLGGSWGTTGPRSINPKTRKPYGPDFPDITYVDMVAAQRLLLESLGVRHLVASTGGSYGGAIAWQWGISYPDMVDGLVVAAMSPTGPRNEVALNRVRERLAKDPNWNGGWYYDRPGGVLQTMTDIRVDTLKAYGLDKELTPTIPDPAARAAEIRARAQPWARAFDAHSLIVKRKPHDYRDLTPHFPRIKAKVLYVLSTTDTLFPPSIAPKIMGDMKAAGVDATYFELVSDQGHSAYNRDAKKWEPALREFLGRLPVRN